MTIIIPNHHEEHILEMVMLTQDAFPEAEIIVANDIKGRGKGWAIRNVMPQVSDDVVAFIDGDMDIHPDSLRLLVYYLRWYDIVIGVKSIGHLPLRRKLPSLGYRMLVKALFRLDISDTQTGVKVFRREALSRWETNGYAFDVEILVKAHKKGCRIYEVPICCKVSGHKGIKDILCVFWDTIKIWFRLSFLAGR